MGGKEDESQRCVKEIKEVRDKEKVNGSDVDPACPY